MHQSQGIQIQIGHSWMLGINFSNLLFFDGLPDNTGLQVQHFSWIRTYCPQKEFLVPFEQLVMLSTTAHPLPLERLKGQG